MGSILMSFYQASRKILALTLATGLGRSALPARQAEAESTLTIRNLNTALNLERNAQARYLKFSKRADQEGYGAVASLFRATAVAEKIHGNNHQNALRKLGGNPDVKTETPVVNSTRENLEAAISRDSRERTAMYPDFIHQARQDRYVPAIVAFQQAMRAEEEHTKFFEEAFRDLDKLKGSGPQTYYVCSVCGYTTTELNFDKSLNCFEPRARYKPVR